MTNYEFKNGVLIIHDGTTKIEDNAFWHREDIVHAIIPEGVTKIGYSAFACCKNMKSVILPSTLKSIGTYAFNFCSSLTSIILPDGLEEIGYSAFACCEGLKFVKIPDSVECVWAEAFYSCSSLTNVDMNPSTTFRDTAFLETPYQRTHTINSYLEPLTTDCVIQENEYTFSINNCCTFDDIPENVYFTNKNLVDALLERATKNNRKVALIPIFYKQKDCDMIASAGALSHKQYKIYDHEVIFVGKQFTVDELIHCEGFPCESILDLNNVEWVLISRENFSIETRVYDFNEIHVDNDLLKKTMDMLNDSYRLLSTADKLEYMFKKEESV